MRYLAAALLSIASWQMPSVADEPSMTMLSAGFEVRQLPLPLTNLVNLQYRYDGKLVALGYNGNIWLLTDSDGDGLEDQAKLFWEGKGKVSGPIGMDLAPKGSPHGQSVFFACKGKVMMITDLDGDDKADAERVIAEGWPLARAGIDAASLCYDARDHSILFGLGVRWYNNAYELDAAGRAHNDLSSERGAILRIHPDLKSRERLCSGVRWPIGLRFNAHGDLFCTDQEGATWLPNGNPFDELLLIQKGRHYGFPPRHPKHLPRVIDEPSVFDYGPQHQSTCGLRFNDGSPHFGPDFWKGDALIAGESRGKIYRTKLVKTEHGYVAQNQVIACTNQLAVDLEVSPRGDLLVATHSGKPDWGSGPEGVGTIFHVRYKDRQAPQPMLMLPDRPERLAIYFANAVPDGIRAGAKLRRGLFAKAGDEYEAIRPGYQVIQLQDQLPAKPVSILGSIWDDGTKALIMLKTEPLSAAETYCLTAAPFLHLDTGLHGVQVLWKENQTCLPHISTQVCRELLGRHTQDLSKTQLTLRTRLDLSNMLHPRQQPGTALDYEPTQEEVTLRISSTNTPFTLKYGKTELKSQLGHVSHDGIFTVKPNAGQPLDIELSCETTEAPQFEISWHTAEDATERAMPLHRFLVPWCKPELTPGIGAAAPRPEIAGGDWKHGEQLFFSDQALCSKCHMIRGKGGKIGPDLSNLTSRDYASVKKDIHEPSAALHPEYVSYEVKLKDGRTLAATVRDEGDTRVLGVGAGVEERVQAKDIVSQTALKVSIMPPLLDEALGTANFRDLMAYLLTEPPLMGIYNDKEAAPAKRTQEEIEALLAGASPAQPRPLKITFVTGPKDHGKGEHDYPRWRSVWSRLFTLAEAVELSIAEVSPSAQQVAESDVIVFYQKGSLEAVKPVLQAQRPGLGLVFIHWAIEAGEEAETLAASIGLASNRRLTRYRHGPVDLVFDPAKQHPISRGFEKLHLADETYWNLVGNGSMHVLASAMEEQQQRPQAWTVEKADATKQGPQRVFVTLGGHYSWSFDDPAFRVLLLRGIAWAAGEPVDRFNNLVRAGW
jgi:putative heme-binding domain-containing protein